MEKYMRLILIFLFVTLALGQNIVIINRGCRQFTPSGECLACSQRYYRDDQGICQPVNVNCNGYNLVTGGCTSCYPGHVLIQDTCLPEAILPAITFDPFCNKFEGNDCVKCAQGYFFDKQGRCKQSDPNCASFNSTDGSCLSCYFGFVLQNTRCIPGQVNPVAQNCNEMGNGVCIKCSLGFYFNKDRICVKIPDDCQNFNLAAGKCEGCYTGYQLNIQNQCVKSAGGVSDLGCSNFENGICTKCSIGYYFNKNKRCLQIPASCAQFNQITEVCINCFPGYALNAVGQCVLSKIDDGCSEFQNGICIKCSGGYYFGKDGLTCKQIPSTCSNFDTVFQKCVACYPGYTVNNKGVCIEDKIGGSNLGCNEFKDGVCVKCSVGYYFGVKAAEKTTCKQIPATCSNFDIKTEKCLGCYSGYELNKAGACVQSAIKPTDPGCAQFKDGQCAKCSFGFYFDAKKKCVGIPTSCAKFDGIKRVCLGCYPGYQLNQKSECVVGKSAEIDPGCNQFKDGVCVKCSFGYYFDNNRCAQIPPSCSSFNVNKKQCQACFQGYNLDKSGKCIKSETANVSDPGCSKFENQVCVQCSQGYYFGKNKVCKLIPTQCARFNTNKEVCEGCYVGYSLNNKFVCTLDPVTSVTDAGCNTFENGVCTKCSFGYYFNDNRKCVQIPVSCARFDVTNRICLQCYSGYQLNIDNQCIQTVNEVTDPGCAKFENNQCVSCSVGYYFDKQRRCKLIPPTCAKFNIAKQMCDSCYPGYGLNDKNQCIQKPPQPYELGCNEFNGTVCLKCSQGYYFNNQNKCQAIPETCRIFDIPTRKCQACYPGYALSKQNQCVVAKEQQIDPYCKTFDSGLCVQCAKGTFFNAAGKCQLINAFCKTFNPADGACTSCYIGYEVKGNTCVVSAQPLGDPHCKTFLNDDCIECSFRYYKGADGKCKQVNPNCKQYTTDGGCTDCYVGFKLEGVRCVQDDTIAGDANCAEWRDGLCMRCSQGTFFDPEGFCRVADPECKTFSELDGRCLTCYIGYIIQGTKCVQDKNNELIDSNCAEFLEEDPLICLKCSKGYIFNADGKCRKVNDLCATYNQKTGVCLSCFVGFELSKGTCIEKIEQVSDLNCAEFDKNGKCTKCSGGFYFNVAGKCTLSNSLCRLFDPKNGKCTECYVGYALVKGQCLRDETKDLCAEYIDKLCIKCAERAYFDDNGKCKLVDDSCNAFDIFNGQCKSCYSGFILEAGKCRKANIGELGCAKYNDVGQCTQCPLRSYLQGKKCIPVPDSCYDFDYKIKSCVGCYSGYALLGGNCEISEVEQGKQIQNCFAYTPTGQCLECFQRFYLKDNVCSQVNIFCKGYDKKNGNCTACYTSFKLSNGQCVRQN